MNSIDSTIEKLKKQIEKSPLRVIDIPKGLECADVIKNKLVSIYGKRNLIVLEGAESYHIRRA